MISSINCAGVIGRYGDMTGVWIAPVTAAVMMAFDEVGLPIRLFPFRFSNWIDSVKNSRH
jgi:hypothetical protein